MDGQLSVKGFHPPFLRAWPGRQPAVAERASSVYGCTEVPLAGAGGALRPSVVFLGLFLVLMLVYRGLADVVGSGATFGIQAALVVALVAGLTWHRRKGAALDPPGRAPSASSPKESGPNEVSDSAERSGLRTGQAPDPRAGSRDEAPNSTPSSPRQGDEDGHSQDEGDRFGAN